MYDLQTLIFYAKEKNTSDVHLTVGLPPMLRIDGELRTHGDVPLTEQDVQDAVQQLADEHQLHELKTIGESDFAVTFADSVRMRCNLFRQQHHTALALRLLPMEIPTAEQLRLPDIIIQQAEKPRGLVIVTGPTGSGKSSTLAALIDHVNRTAARHIITLENPIEYVHPRIRSMINQREIGADTDSFASGLRAALRQDPDVILVGEMRDLETISTAITAAETGHLVMSTLHTIGAAQTIDRIIDVCPAGAQNQIRGQLAAVLRGVITQQLLPLAVGKGRCAATEILVGTDAVANLIREGKCYQIPSILQSGAALGMHSLNADLARLVSTGRITREAAERCATNKSDLKNYL